MSDRSSRSSSDSGSPIIQLYTRGVRDESILVRPEEIITMEEIIRTIPLLEGRQQQTVQQTVQQTAVQQQTEQEGIEQQETEQGRREQQPSEQERNYYLKKLKDILFSYGTETVIYSAIVNWLSVLPSMSTMSSLSIGYPFIALVSHSASKIFSSEFLCKSTFKILGERLSTYICKLIGIFIYYFFLFGTTNMVFMYLLAPGATTVSFFIQYSKKLIELSKTVTNTFQQCSIDSINEVIKYQGRGAGFEISLLQQAKEDLPKIKEIDFTKILEKSSVYSISFATNLGLLGVAKNLNEYIKGVVDTSVYLLEESKKGALGYLQETFLSVAKYFIDTGIAENVVLNKTEFLKNITQNPFEKSNSAVSLQQQELVKLNEVIQKLEISKVNTNQLDPKYQSSIGKLGNEILDFLYPESKNLTIWDIISINSKKISETKFQKMNSYILDQTMMGTVNLIESLQNSSIDTIKQLTRTNKFTNCSKMIFADLYKFNEDVQGDLINHDRSLDFNPNNDLFKIMPKYQVFIPNLFGIEKNESLKLSSSDNLQKSFDYIALGSFNTMSILVIIILFFLFYVKIILAFSRLFDRNRNR